MGKSSDSVQETPQERAVADIGAQKWDRYKKVFAPFESMMIADVQNTKPKLARALAVTGGSTQQAFSRAQGKVDSSLAKGRVAPGSGRFMGAQAGLALDRAKSLGLGLNDASDLVNRQKISGEQGLVQIGQGKSAEAIKGFAESARRAESQAESDARASATNREAMASAIGTVAGAGLDAYQAGRTPVNTDVGGNVVAYGAEGGYDIDLDGNLVPKGGG